MPRDGSGASDNAIEQGETLIHGAGNAPGDVRSSGCSHSSTQRTTFQGASASGVDRSSKAAPLPEAEKGDALEGMNASGGGSFGKSESGSGKGDAVPSVDKEAAKQQ